MPANPGRNPFKGNDSAPLVGIRYRNGITRRQGTMSEMSKSEALARGWMLCDPNRGGSDPDEIDHSIGGDLNGKPRWHWFIPRAEAMEAHLLACGWKLVPYFDDAGRIREGE